MKMKRRDFLRTTGGIALFNVLPRNLLEETDQSLTDIAQAAGFYDFSHFFHTFRRERGLTPAQYRARHRSV